MILPLSALKYGTRFRYAGHPWIRCNAGRATAICARPGAEGLGFQELNLSVLVEVPPFSIEDELRITEEEEAFEREMQERKITMLDRIRADVHPDDQE